MLGDFVYNSDPTKKYWENRIPIIPIAIAEIDPTNPFSAFIYNCTDKSFNAKNVIVAPVGQIFGGTMRIIMKIWDPTAAAYIWVYPL